MIKKLIVSSVVLSLMFGLALSASAAKKPKRTAIAKPASVLPSQASYLKLPAAIKIKGGYGGGGGRISGSYLLPLNPALYVGLDAGFGIGSGFTVPSAGLMVETAIAGLTVDIGINYVKYSVAVQNVPGVSGNVTADAKTTGILLVGKEVSLIGRTLNAEVGYDTALGLLANLGIKL